MVGQMALNHLILVQIEAGQQISCRIIYNNFMAENTVAKSPKASGCGPMMFFIILVAIATLIFGVNAGLGWYGPNCGGLSFSECIDEIMTEEEEVDEDVVAATGPYAYKDYSIVMTAQIPLDGGAVEGTITGDCNGRVTGSYDGQNGGSITGKMAGSCNIFFVNVPASATFSGVVNKESKTVPINFQGSGGGFSHEDSMSLAY